MANQRTIEKEISLKGVGLHTAHKVNVTFKPAEADSGISFVRIDLPAKPVIKASVGSLLSQPDSPRRTSIGSDGAHIYTIEHLMAALSGAGIDNIRIEIDNDEVPGLDGSSLNFLEILGKAGIKELDKPRRGYSLKEPIFIEEDNCSIIALPSEDFKISYTLNYNHSLLKAQFLSVQLNEGAFQKELAPSRTFCLESEAQDLQGRGMGLGANYENTLVVGETGVIKNKLRYQDEFVRHKMLDLYGDLYVLGEPLKAHIIAVKSGHSLNLKMVKKIDQQRQKYPQGAARGAGGHHPQEAAQFGIETIMKILPHREPFLFVDKILSLEVGKRVTGVKNVTINDYFFKGHFPGKPVMPGVLILEAMAQVGGVMMLSPEENRGKLAYFMSADNVKFRKPVVPGDQLILEAEAGKIKARTGQVHARALVDGKVAVEADFMFVLVEN